MFVLTQSYTPGWRVFFPTDMNPEAHAKLKSLSMWGGHDKREEFGGMECLGYEFNTMEKALEAIQFVVKSLL